MSVLVDPSLKDLEKLIIDNEDMLMLVYLSDQFDQVRSVIEEVNRLAKNDEPDFKVYEITIVKNNDLKDHFGVNKSPVLLLFHGGWLLYQTNLTAEKTKKIIEAIKSFPLLKSMTDEEKALSDRDFEEMNGVNASNQTTPYR